MKNDEMSSKDRQGGRSIGRIAGMDKDTHNDSADTSTSIKKIDDTDTDTTKDDPPQVDSYFPDPRINNPTAAETVSWWSENTSVHGLYYVLERTHFRAWKRAVWAVLVLAATIGLLWAVVIEFQDYAKYSINTSTETIVPPYLSFPQVTICNTNKYDSSLQNSTGIQEPRNEKELNRISQPLEEFILYTSFNGEEHQNLSEVWKPVITPFGRCYTYATDEHVFVPGGSAGLTVYTWLNQSNYEDSTLLAGINVFVTQKGSPITEQSPEVLVPPGAASFISAGRIEFQRERRYPWSRCKGTTPEYSIEKCRAECIDAATREQCGCRPIGDKQNKTMRFCNSGDVECRQTIGGEELEGCKSCSVAPCDEEVYHTQYSAARVAIKGANRIEDSLGLDPGQFGNNFVQVNVNYDLIRYSLVTESRATSPEQLLSNLGGNMGFFMGLSMISVVEIFGELLCLRLIPRSWGDKRLYGLGQKKMN